MSERIAREPSRDNLSSSHTYPKEKSEAVAHLDFAIAEFREMKMQPSLERALRHKEILKA